MTVNRIRDIDISERGFILAIDGNYSDAFVDKDLCAYTFEEQLYLYLKEFGYDRVFFYNRAPGFGLYSFDREALASLLSDDDPEDAPSSGGLLKPRTTNSSSNTIKQKGKRFYFTNVKDTSLKTRLPSILEDFNYKSIIYFTSEGFEFKSNGDRDGEQGFIDNLTMIRDQISANSSMNKLLFKKNAIGLFEHHFFAEATKDPKNVFSVGLPDEEECENWLNMNRIKGNLDSMLVFSFPYEKLVHQIFLRQSTITQLNKELKSDKSNKHKDYLNSFKMEDFSEELLARHLANVLGQKDNIDQITPAIITWINRPDEYKKPLVLMFAGTSGTGKTYTAEMITEALKSLGYLFVKLPMNEYQSKGDAWKLLGSAPGYVGSGEDTALISAYKKSKKFVILFDEIEKAHPSLFETIMTLMEKGELTNSKGEVMDFRKSIIIFTTNLAMRELWNKKEEFLNGSIDINEFHRSTKSILIDHGIKPEICGRISMILVYNQLGPEIVAKLAIVEIRLLGKIYELQINNISRRLLQLTIAAASNSSFGDRPIKDFVQQQLERKIQEIHKSFTDTIVDIDDNLDFVETSEDHLLSAEEIISRQNP